MDWIPLVGKSMLLVCILGVLYAVFSALRKGYIVTAGHIHRRRDDPVMFWVPLTVLACMGGGALAIWVYVVFFYSPRARH